MASGMYEEINIKTMGAKGDGVSDDTAIINLALNDLVQNNGGVIYFPPGIYAISSSLVTGNNVMFRGSGLGCTQISRISGFAGSTFNSISGVVRVRDMFLPDFSVGGNNTPPAIPASGVLLVNPFPFVVLVNIIAGTISNIAINGTSTGLTSNTSGVDIILNPGQSVTLTYSVVPTSWTWLGLGG